VSTLRSLQGKMFRITQILLLLLLAYQLVAKETASSSALPRQESCTNSRVRRSLFNILWACFTTTIIHAWVAVPFDIPARERPLKGALRRLGLIFWTIFLAEFVCLRAVKELLAAITVRDVYNKRGVSWNISKSIFMKQLQGLRRGHKGFGIP